MNETKPKLRDKAAFEKVLSGYKMSDHALKVLHDTNLVVMSGVAGGGRNTVINKLVETGKYHFIVSDTTRPPKFRDGALEQDGVHYFFRKEEDLLKDLQNGEFLEAEIIHQQQVSGISIRELQRANQSGKIAINEIEFGGINNIATAKPDTHVIGLLPPSYEAWIERFRGREEIHEEEFINRLHTAEKVLENMVSKPYFRIVINDDLDECVEFLREVVETGVYTEESRQVGLTTAQDMLDKVRLTLKEHADKAS